MGCFDQSCFFTRLTIKEGEDCYLFPIVKNESCESLNDHAFRMYKPFCLPIKGKYNDYGSIEHIVKDANTEALEKYFETSIEEIVEMITGHHRYDYYYEDTPIHRVYARKSFVITKESLAQAQFETDSDAYVTHPVVQKMQKYNEDIQRYPVDYKGNRWEMPKIRWNENGDLVIIQSYENRDEVYKAGSQALGYNGFFSQIERLYKILANNSRYGEYIFGLPDEFQARARIFISLTSAFMRPEVFQMIDTPLVNSWNSWNKDDWRAKATRELAAVVKDMREAKAIYDDNKTEDKKILWQAYDKLNSCSELMRNSFLYSFASRGLNANIFSKIYLDYLDNPEILSMLESIRNMNSAMIRSNIMLIETHNLEQHGQRGEQLQVNRLITKLAAKLSRDWDKECNG